MPVRIDRFFDDPGYDPLPGALRQPCLQGPSVRHGPTKGQCEYPGKGVCRRFSRHIVVCGQHPHPWRLPGGSSRFGQQNQPRTEYHYRPPCLSCFKSRYDGCHVAPRGRQHPYGRFRSQQLPEDGLSFLRCSSGFCIKPCRGQQAWNAIQHGNESFAAE